MSRAPLMGKGSAKPFETNHNLLYVCAPWNSNGERKFMGGGFNAAKARIFSASYYRELQPSFAPLF